MTCFSRGDSISINRILVDSRLRDRDRLRLPLARAASWLRVGEDIENIGRVKSVTPVFY